MATAASEAMTTAPAPSQMPEAEPAVTTPPTKLMIQQNFNFSRVRPCLPSAASEAMTTAPAPSQIPEAEPAVTTPPTILNCAKLMLHQYF